MSKRKETSMFTYHSCRAKALTEIKDFIKDARAMELVEVLSAISEATNETIYKAQSPGVIKMLDNLTEKVRNSALLLEQASVMERAFIKNRKEN